MADLLTLQKRFIALRFGTFIHFNSATFQFCAADAAFDDWEYGHENDGLPRRFPFNEADWNPEKLDCTQWAKAAKAAGCRFAALTTKHHEGFALWPTAYSAHCVKNGTCKRDVVKEYLDAFRAEGIEAGLYFSILDLTAGIGKNSCTEEQKQMIKGQVTELLTNYGHIPFLVTDGWNAPWGGPTHEMLPFAELDALVKELQPDCLLMNIGCTDDIHNTDVIFFENAAGQKVEGEFHGPGISCNKLTRTWFWKETDPADTLQSADWAVAKAQECFPQNINFIMNLSPGTSGLLDDNQVRAMEEIGRKLTLPAFRANELPNGWLVRSSVRKLM